MARLSKVAATNRADAPTASMATSSKTSINASVSALADYLPRIPRAVIVAVATAMAIPAPQSSTRSQSPPVPVVPGDTPVRPPSALGWATGTLAWGDGALARGAETVGRAVGMAECPADRWLGDAAATPLPAPSFPPWKPRASTRPTAALMITYRAFIEPPVPIRSMADFPPGGRGTDSRFAAPMSEPCVSTGQNTRLAFRDSDRPEYFRTDPGARREVPRLLLDCPRSVNDIAAYSTCAVPTGIWRRRRAGCGGGGVCRRARQWEWRK